MLMQRVIGVHSHQLYRVNRIHFAFLGQVVTMNSLLRLSKIVIMALGWRRVDCILFQGVVSFLKIQNLLLDIGVPSILVLALN